MSNSFGRLPGPGEFILIFFALIGAVVIIGTIVSAVVAALAWVAAQVTGVGIGVAAGYIVAVSVGAGAGWVARAIYDVPNGDSHDH